MTQHDASNPAVYLNVPGWLDACGRQRLHPNHDKRVADKLGIPRRALKAAKAGQPVDGEFIVRATVGFTDLRFTELFRVA